MYLRSDRAFDPHHSNDITWAIELRRVMRHLGIDPDDNIIIGHPGPPFMMLGFRFITRFSPRAAVDRFLDDELGIPWVNPHVNAALKLEGDTLVNTIYPRRTSTVPCTLHPQASYGRDPGDENADKRR